MKLNTLLSVTFIAVATANISSAYDKEIPQLNPPAQKAFVIDRFNSGEIHTLNFNESDIKYFWNEGQRLHFKAFKGDENVRLYMKDYEVRYLDTLDKFKKIKATHPEAISTTLKKTGNTESHPTHLEPAPKTKNTNTGSAKP